MSEAKKAPRRVYLIHKISVPSDVIDEFNQVWKEKGLPVWEQQGAKLIVAGRNVVGGSVAEITRVYEFENLAQWSKRQEAQWDLWEKDMGPGRTSTWPEFLRYPHTLEARLLRAIY